MTTHDVRPSQEQDRLSEADSHTERQPIDQDLDGRPDGWRQPTEETPDDGRTEFDAFADPERERRDPEAFGPVTGDEPVADGQVDDRVGPVTGEEPVADGRDNDRAYARDNDGAQSFDGSDSRLNGYPARDVDQEPAAPDADAYVAATETHRKPEAASGELLPADIEPQPASASWNEDSTAELRNRWRELQLRFVDDPIAAADEAEALVGEAVDSLTRSLREQLDAVDDHRVDGKVDTEQLRVAVHRYRDVLDRVLSS